MNELIALYYFVGRKIREERHKRGWSQDDLCQRIGVARTSVVHWEEGKNRVQVEDLYRLAKTFGITIHDLLPDYSDRLMKTQEQAFLDFLKQDGGAI